MCAVVLAHVATRSPVRQRHAKGHAARHDRHLARPHIKNAQLGRQHDPALLRYQQHLAICIDQCAPGHRTVGEIYVRRQAGLGISIAVGDNGTHAVHKIQRSIRNPERPPAQGIRRDSLAPCSASRPQSLRIGLMGADHYRRLAPVKPGTKIVRTRRRKRRARHQFGVQRVRRALRAVAPLRQGTLDGLAGKLVAKSGLVAQAGSTHCVFSEIVVSLSTSSLSTLDLAV